MKAVYRRTPTIGVEDVAVTTHDFWRGTDPDTAYADTVAAAYSTFWTAIASNIASEVTLIELRFYLGYNGDGTPGEVDYIKSYSLSGSNPNGMLPPQCACSVTEIVSPGTSGRRRWGRFYLPGVSKERTDNNGRFISSTVNAIANAAETFYDGLRDGTDGPIVWHGGSSPESAHSMVDSIRVDDIVDIIRRRRWDAYLTRVTKPIE